MSKQCLCLAVKIRILTEIPGDGFCLYLLLSPYLVEFLEEEELKQSIRSGLFLWSVPLFTEEMEKSLLVVIQLLFKVQENFSHDHWCTEHILCIFSPSSLLSPLAPSFQTR